VIGADAVKLAQERFGLASPPEGPLVPRERLVEFARALYDELGYHYLSYITAVHYPPPVTGGARGEKAAKHGAAHGAATSQSAAAAQPAASSGDAVQQPAPHAAAAQHAVAAQPQVAAQSQLAAQSHVAPPPAEAAPAVVEPIAPEPVPPARFIVVYRVRNIARNSEYPFRCEVTVGTSVPSLCSVWAGADWQEREAYDLVGPVFEGHPDLRRIMLPEDWEGHPLQRQYAIDTPHRPWR
jgi:NADH:ubiquinone oxidoreductase subunit C